MTPIRFINPIRDAFALSTPGFVSRFWLRKSKHVLRLGLVVGVGKCRAAIRTCMVALTYVAYAIRYYFSQRYLFRVGDELRKQIVLRNHVFAAQNLVQRGNKWFRNVRTGALRMEKVRS